MPPAPFRARAKALFKKRQLLIWLALASLLVGVTAFGEPLDLSLHTLRNKIRSQPVSGKVVVVGIDDDSLMKVGPWPWNREKLATLTQRLFDNGANRVFIDIFLRSGEPQGDRQLAQVVARYPGRVLVTSGLGNPGTAQAGKFVLPMPEIAKVSETVSELKWLEFWNGVATLTYASSIDGKPHRSMESAIANVSGGVDEKYPIDYSFRVASIPYLSAAHVLSDTNAAVSVKGRDVLIGINSPTTGDMFFVPGQTRSARPFIVVAGAETLLRGRPLVLGWWPGWLLAVGGAACLLYAKRRIWGSAAAFVTLTAVLVGPLLLEANNIFIDVAPAIVLILSAMVAAAWLRFGARKRSQGATNPVSGLPTATAILHGDQLDSGFLVAVRVRHFIDIISALPPDRERELLKQIVTRMTLGTGGAQLLHGDDGNFFWLAPSPEQATVIDQFKALQLIFRTPIQVFDRSFDVDVAFGLDQETHMPLSHRLASALAAAHAASQQGVGWKVHDPATSGAKEWTLSLLGELDQAIQSGQIWVAYQPKLDLATRTFVGAEALVRWTHATRGPINPAEFVEVADRHGRIGKITSFVLEDAAQLVKDARQWVPDFTVSVNISPSQLTNREVIDMVDAVLLRHDIPAESLILEVTESAAMAEEGTAQALLEELRAKGVGLSIDDYGTGMSTLEYLRRIPASELKVDRRFASALATNAQDQAVMRSTIELAHALGMKVVVEGIEQAETLYMLAGMGCDIGQGYHIGRPADGTSLLELLEPQKHWAFTG
ncbi:EAL domain-containing protein [Sphingobium phenoxybenzoativorans]|uniref:EAL domain-containing protein n=1 Tax=Sphingobium phenoxybenzoativorans TaxID=1592790 RepID=UPI000872A64D|nr:EAL domain-containing protein [Sphingobium phenoxybenzoativorans]